RPVAAHARAGDGDGGRVRVAAVQAADGGVPNGHNAVGGPVLAGGDVEGVEALHVVGNAVDHLLGLDHDVHRVGRAVDDRRPGDADLGHDVPGNDVGLGDRGDPAGRVDETALPELAAAVSVEGVDAVVLRGREHDVVCAARDGQVGHVKRLGVGVAVDRVVEQPAEVGRVDAGGGQERLLRVAPGKRGA